jgi:hypothetical protein
MARHAAVPSSVSNVFDLGSIACSIQHSVFDVVRVCEHAVGQTMFLVVVCSMQGRRRCILDGVGISVQRILVSILISHKQLTAHGDRCSCWFYLRLGVLWSPHLALWLPILSSVCTTLRLARRARNDVHSLTYPPMITLCYTPSSLPAGQLQLSALSVSGARPYGADAITGYQVTAGVYYGATCGGAQQRFQCLRS